MYSEILKFIAIYRNFDDNFTLQTNFNLNYLYLDFYEAFWQ